VCSLSTVIVGVVRGTTRDYCNEFHSRVQIYAIGIAYTCTPTDSYLSRITPQMRVSGIATV